MCCIFPSCFSPPYLPLPGNRLLWCLPLSTRFISVYLVYYHFSFYRLLKTRSRFRMRPLRPPTCYIPGVTLSSNRHAMRPNIPLPAALMLLRVPPLNLPRFHTNPLIQQYPAQSPTSPVLHTSHDLIFQHAFII